MDYRRKQKAVPPTTTINGVRAALADVGILLSEMRWSTFAGSYSVSLGDLGVRVATNGKGTTRELALASAYAEFMERLQNGCLYRWSFGRMEELHFRFPDERDLTIDECVADGEVMGLTRELVTELAGSDNALPCLPFFDCRSRELRYFPVAVLYRGFSNTGQCAGNTPNEAILQGICEVFERHISQLAFIDDEIVFPTIPLDRITNPEITRMVSAIARADYQLIVKDLTLGGRFPVLAVVMLDRSRTRMRVSAGSAVIAKVALERCLTELGQGLDMSGVDARMTEVNLTDDEYATVQFASAAEQRADEQERWRHNKSGRYPLSILRSAEAPSDGFERAFMSGYPDPDQGLRFLLDILAREDLRLFVRDVSFLGLPSYYVYIPTMSERISWQQRTIDAGEQQRIAKLLLSSSSASDAELGEVAAYFSKRARSASANHTNFPDFFGLHVPPSPLGAFPRFVLWAMIHNRLGEYARAYECLSFAMKLGDYNQLYQSALASVPEEMRPGLPSPAQIYWLTLYFRLRKEERSQRYIEATLVDIFGAQLCKLMITIVGDRTRFFGSMRFPRCGDCSQCDIVEACDYPVWKERVLRINARMAESFPRQEALAGILES